jgi:carbon-monoxide dehydrogenase small subunit
VNGERRTDDVPAQLLLVEYLRESLGLTGTKVGCETSVCGACTVLVGGEPVKSCTMFTAQAEGTEITTIEGLGDSELFLDVSEALTAEHGVQCGFCTPGVVVSATALLDANAKPSDEDILSALDGHLCRCTGYVGIIRAINRAAGRRRGRQPSALAGRSLSDPLAVHVVASGAVAGADVEVV